MADLFLGTKVRYNVITLLEHAAVNRRVVGSSPTGGAIKKPVNFVFTGFSYALMTTAALPLFCCFVHKIMLGLCITYSPHDCPSIGCLDKN